MFIAQHATGCCCRGCLERIHKIPKGKALSNEEKRTYHHYFYEVDKDVDGEYFSLNELLQKEKVKENNGDIIKFIEEFYCNK